MRLNRRQQYCQREYRGFLRSPAGQTPCRQARDRHPNGVSTVRIAPKPPEVGGLAEHGIPSLLPVVKLSRTTSTCCANRWKTRYQEKLPVEKSPRTSLNEGLMISLREVGFFDSGSADIRPSSRSAFDRLAAVLQSADTD